MAEMAETQASQGVHSEDWKVRQQEWKAREAERKAQPVTAGDIDRLIHAINSGWIGRGFAIGLGTALLGLVAGLILSAIWGAGF